MGVERINMEAPFTNGLLAISAALAESHPQIDIPSVASGIETGLRIALSDPAMVKRYVDGLEVEENLANNEYDKGMEKLDNSIAKAMTMILEGVK